MSRSSRVFFYIDEYNYHNALRIFRLREFYKIVIPFFGNHFRQTIIEGESFLRHVALVCKNKRSETAMIDGFNAIAVRSFLDLLV